MTLVAPGDTFEMVVTRMTNSGVARHAAERHIRCHYPALAFVHDESNRRNAAILEKDEQAAVMKLFREHGFKVRSTSQARRSKIAIGFPDLFVTHRVRGLGFFFETKRQVGGVVSEAQQEFADDCKACEISWFTGDRFVAQQLIDRWRIPRL